jgi:predicted NAD/FAD-dependent oxidoreductase
MSRFCGALEGSTVIFTYPVNGLSHGACGRSFCADCRYDFGMNYFSANIRHFLTKVPDLHPSVAAPDSET